MRRWIQQIFLVGTISVPIATSGAPKIERPVSDAEFTRRGLLCMVGLGGVAAVAGGAELVPEARARWNARMDRVELPEAERGAAVRWLDGVATVMPGMITNAFLGRAFDVVSDYVRTVQGCPDKTNPKYLDTMMKANMVMVGKLAMLTLFPASIGANAKAEDLPRVQLIRQNPFDATVQIAVIAPVIEELLFRLLPARVSTGWTVGTASGVVFAAAHMVTAQGVRFDRIPATQFIGGLFYWYLLRERGLDHAVLAHAANNNAFVMGLYLNNRFP